MLASIKPAISRLKPVASKGALGSVGFGLGAEDAAEFAEVAGGAWAFPALPTPELPEEPDGLCTFLTVLLEFEIEKNEELDN
jgi:hypothetical protein